MSRPQPPPEAQLIRLAREAAHIRTADAAAKADISKARWSQIETGYESRDGEYRSVIARAVTLAHMAHAVGLTPERLAETGRQDAAEILREINRGDERMAAIAEALLEPGDPDGFRRLAMDQDPNLTVGMKRWLLEKGRERLALEREAERAERDAS
jgi:transcriptional regulator with XRE-family HTH domain